MRHEDAIRLTINQALYYLRENSDSAEDSQSGRNEKNQSQLREELRQKIEYYSGRKP